MAGKAPSVKRRLLFVVNVDWFFLSHRLPIAQAALREGYEVHVAAALTPPVSKLHELGFVVHPLSLDRGSAGVLSTLVLLLRLRSLFREVRPDLVHLVTIKPVLLGALAARWARVPAMVAAVSGLGTVFTAFGAGATLRRGLVSLLYRIAMGHPNAVVIFQNQDDRRLVMRLAGLHSRRTEVIRGSGVDLSCYRAQPYPRGQPVILMASRLLAKKGVREFVEAARRLRGDRTARFVLVGDVDVDNPTSLKRAEVQAWVDEGIVEWWGHRNDMAKVLALAHVVVLPSYREGLPKVLIEAAACGRAVVTTDVPGCRDAIIPNETGLLVPTRDPAALAAAIRRLIGDRALTEAMGAAGRRLAESAFDVQQVVARHLAIYHRLLLAQSLPVR
jgi:glycosyltransferase involved in cell wall biosynthesis